MRRPVQKAGVWDLAGQHAAQGVLPRVRSEEQVGFHGEGLGVHVVQGHADLVRRLEAAAAVLAVAAHELLAQAGVHGGQLEGIGDVFALGVGDEPRRPGVGLHGDVVADLVGDVGGQELPARGYPQGRVLGRGLREAPVGLQVDLVRVRVVEAVHVLHAVLGVALREAVREDDLDRGLGRGALLGHEAQGPLEALAGQGRVFGRPGRDADQRRAAILRGRCEGGLERLSGLGDLDVPGGGGGRGRGQEQGEG